MPQRILRFFVIVHEKPCPGTGQTITHKKHELAAKIAELQKMQAGLTAFETQLKQAQGQCSSISMVAI